MDVVDRKKVRLNEPSTYTTHATRLRHVVVTWLTTGVVPVGGANTEMVLDGLTGWVYDAADPTSLPRLLCRVAALDPAERAAAGRRAQVRAAGLFTPERCAAEYLDVCHAVTGACRPATAQPQIVDVPACG